jgi:hypothetical protein
MEKTDGQLIPPPALVRDRLARNLRENQLLRSLLRVSERAAEEASADDNRAPSPTRPALADGIGRP